MRRLQDYCSFIVWQAGFGYLLMWAVTLWTLDQGATVFGGSGVCRPDDAKVLFYWVCEARSPLSILATLANVALTATVWAPVYLAAATVTPDAAGIAGLIITVHLIGLPLAILVLVRMMAAAFDLRRRLGVRRGQPPVPAAAAAAPVAPPQAAKTVAPRSEFGLRRWDDRRPRAIGAGRA